MFIKVAHYTINTENIIYIVHQEDQGQIVINFVEGKVVTLSGEDAKRFVGMVELHLSSVQSR